jgi:6-phosphogluconolactonase
MADGGRTSRKILDRSVNGNNKVHIFSSIAEFERGTADEVLHVLRNAIQKQGMCSVVLSGGETPRGIYRMLATDLLKKSLDWTRVHVFFSDERCVAPDDPQSNYGMIERELLAHVNIPPVQIHRMHGEAPPEEAATEYQEVLRTFFRNDVPRFDLVLLGIGEDGHTASLFPSTDVLGERKSWTRAVYLPRLKNWRITLTFPCINAGQNLLILGAGEPKAHILQRVFAAKVPTNELPVTLIRPTQGSLLWMLDHQAASRLDSSKH